MERTMHERGADRIREYGLLTGDAMEKTIGTLVRQFGNDPSMKADVVDAIARVHTSLAALAVEVEGLIHAESKTMDKARTAFVLILCISVFMHIQHTINEHGKELDRADMRGRLPEDTKAKLAIFASTSMLLQHRDYIPELMKHMFDMFMSHAVYK